MPSRRQRPTFATERLALRPVEAGDEEVLAALDSDPKVMRYIHTGVLTQAMARRWAELQIEMAPHRWHMHKWLAELNESHVKVGWVELGKFHGTFDPAEQTINDDISIGYEFSPAYWHQGLASEAIRAILDYAFDTLELSRVVAFVHMDNERSIRLLEKLGFRRHPTRRYKDDGGNKCFLYSLVITDWRP
jgi:RimJ/RimL family protein N-acetyltransferase